MVRGRFLAVSSQTKLHTAVVDNKEEIYCLEMIKKALKWSQSRSFTTMVVLVFFVLLCCTYRFVRCVCLNLRNVARNVFGLPVFGLRAMRARNVRAYVA